MIEKNTKLWAENLSKEWATFLPPERPSPEELAIYEDYLLKVVRKRGKGIKALLLGATPEVRDLLARHGIETVCADINPAMVEAMNKLLEISDGSEKIIITDWNRVSYPDEEFDLILGDHSLHWILFDQWDDFFRDKLRLMKKGGFIIFNVVTDTENQMITVDEMVEIYKKKGYFSREEKFYFQYLAVLGLPDKDLKYTKHLDEYNDRLKELERKGSISQKEYALLACPWMGGFCPTMPPKAIVDQYFNRHYILKSVRYSPVNPSVSCHKIYFAQKN